MKYFTIAALFGAMTASSGAAHAEHAYCREYTKTFQVGGRLQEGYGMACLRPDGSWEVAREAEPDPYPDPITPLQAHGPRHYPHDNYADEQVRGGGPRFILALGDFYPRHRRRDAWGGEWERHRHRKHCRHRDGGHRHYEWRD